MRPPSQQTFRRAQHAASARRRTRAPARRDERRRDGQFFGACDAHVGHGLPEPRRREARHHMHQHVRPRPHGAALELRQLRPDFAGAHRLHAVDGRARRHAGRLWLLVRRHVRRIHGRARGAGRAVASAAHRPRAVRRSVAVRGRRERGRPGAARYLGQRPHAVGAWLQFAGRAGRAARRLQMPRARRRRRSMGRDQRAHGARMAAIRRRDRFSGLGERCEVPDALSTDAEQRRARRQRLALDGGAQRRRRDGDAAARGHRSGGRRKRRRPLRARSATERARLLARRLNAKGSADSRHRHTVQAFRRVGKSYAG